MGTGVVGGLGGAEGAGPVASLVAGAVGWGWVRVLGGLSDGVLAGGVVGLGAGVFVGLSVAAFAVTWRVGVPGESPAGGCGAAFVGRPA
ncbi:hypothetical protein C0Q98_06500 [Streptomyces albidoflavus]|uniref:Uncharacterized protein n=1 Tax=Streptomyces albidoflavus TaxID=1886 RepID=A0AB37XLE9_9ACTN|nr:hypothetical protein B9S66_24395 [Streptomyces sp. SM17]RZE44226.1 hypothetical protein C0Q91_06390 [Streptomyces albidoflavus]RZE64052.1 hypothetical protein C0Q98_06500 [Streptomyces albidoflavus]BDH50113.1 hypothetical protein MTP02_11240 [Streptomyces albus]